MTNCVWCTGPAWLCMHRASTDEVAEAERYLGWLRRMGEPVPGSVVKLEATPDDDPFYTDPREANGVPG